MYPKLLGYIYPPEFCANVTDMLHGISLCLCCLFGALGLGLLSQLSQSSLDHSQGSLGDTKALTSNENSGQQGKSTSLVGSGQGNGNHVDEGADAESNLQRNEMEEAGDSLFRSRGKDGLDLARAAVGNQSADGSEGGDGQDTVVKLDKRGVLEHVAPDQIRTVLVARVELVQELGLGGSQAVAHHRELVVNETGVETSNEGARENSGEDEHGEGSNGTAEDSKGRRLESSEVLDGLLGELDGLVSAENAETGKKHPGVADESGSKMGGETVLADTGVGAGSKEVILETGLDHPPANEALEADESRDANKSASHARGDAATSNEVDGGEDEGHADEAAPETMSPLHEVDLLELGEGHARVEHLELGRGAVLFKLGLPLLLGARPEGTSDGSPFRDTQAVERVSDGVRLTRHRDMLSRTQTRSSGSDHQRRRYQRQKQRWRGASRRQISSWFPGSWTFSQTYQRTRTRTRTRTGRA